MVVESWSDLTVGTIGSNGVDPVSIQLLDDVLKVTAHRAAWFGTFDVLTSISFHPKVKPTAHSEKSQLREYNFRNGSCLCQILAASER